MMKRIAEFRDPAETRKILECRSLRNKIGVPVDCEMTDPATLPAITELVAAGVIVWIDRAMLPQIGIFRQGTLHLGVQTDIYLLTPAGVALCEREGIEPN